MTFKNADTNYTVGSPAIADSAIAVAAYVTRGTWTDYVGNNRQYSDPNWRIIGTITPYSSHGPRIDGRMKPDIAAPGQGIISVRDTDIVTFSGGSYGYYDPYVIDNDGTNDGNGPADYMLAQGTSMACPVAAGAAALLMQSNPLLIGDPNQVKSALFNAASNGCAQTNTDGYGNLDINGAIQSAIQTPTPTPTPSGCDGETTIVETDTVDFELLKLENKVVTVTVTDAGGCPVADEKVSAKVNRAGKKRVKISPSSKTTDENGAAAFTITAKKKTGKAKVTFKAGGIKKKINVKIM